MSLLAVIFRAARRDFVVAILASVTGGAAGVGLIAVVQKILRGAAPANGILLFFVCLSLSVTGKLVCQLVLVTSGQKAATTVRLHLCRRILATPLRQLETIGVAPLMATLTEDVLSLSGIMWVLPEGIVSACVTIGGMGYLLVISPVFFGVVTLGVVIASASYMWLRAKSVPVLIRARVDQDALLQRFTDLLGGAKELKLNSERRTKFLDEALRASALSYEGHAIRSMQLVSIASQWVNVFSFAIIGLLLFTPTRPHHLPSASLREAILTLVFLVSPLASVIAVLPGWTRANVALRKIASLKLSEPGVGRELAMPSRPLESFESVTLVDACHAYRGEREDQSFVLGPISLVIRRGETVFVAGANGSGKTTLTKLLVGLYLPEQGSVRINDRELTAHNLDWYRQHFSAIFSTPYIFATLVGADGATLSERANHYLAKLHLEHKVRVEAGGSPRSSSRRDSASVSPLSAPTWKTAPCMSSTNGRPIKIHRSRRSSTASCFPSSRREARPWS